MTFQIVTYDSKTFSFKGFKLNDFKLNCSELVEKTVTKINWLFNWFDIFY